MVLNDLKKRIARWLGVPTASSGPAFDGAGRFNQQFAGWTPGLNSADADLLPEKPLLDARSRESARNDAYIQSGATLHKDGIIGSVYALNSKPDIAFLGQSEAWAEAFQEEVESRFMLWAESPCNRVDATGQNSFTAMLRQAIGVYVQTGEILATAEWIKRRGCSFNTAIRMIDTDRLSTPDDVLDDRVRAGIRHNSRGVPVSYYIRTRHPRDYGSFGGLSSCGAAYWKPVRARTPWGRPQVLHIREQLRVDQTRGIADMVAGLREIAITRRFRDITLQNAVVNAMYAASIESELPSEMVYGQMGGGDVRHAIDDYAGSYLSAVGEYAGASGQMKLDGTRIPHLFPGTKLRLHQAGTPGGVGQDFERSLLRYIASSLGVSYEELSRDYTRTNYSSARAAQASTWKFFQSRKKITADRMAGFIFRLWLEEAINKNHLDSFPAKQAHSIYTDGSLNMRFDALSSCDWIGASRGQIDELKETQASALRIKYGLSTQEMEAARLGQDWRRLYRQLAREERERKKRGLSLNMDDAPEKQIPEPQEKE